MDKDTALQHAAQAEQIGGGSLGAVLRYLIEKVNPALAAYSEQPEDLAAALVNAGLMEPDA